MPKPEFTREISLATVRAMIAELDERLGDDNPYRDIDVEAYSDSELYALRRALHEVTYVPPTRGRI